MKRGDTMRKQIKAIFMVLLFVVLLSPIKVAGFSYDMNPSYKGVYVEIDNCVEQDDYYIDIVVLKAEIDDSVSPSGAGYPYPSSINSNEYGDYSNEWISMSKFYDPGPTIRETCRVNFYGQIEDVSEVPFSEYKVIIYDDGELIASSVEYPMSEISFSGVVGSMIVFDSDNSKMIVQSMYIDNDDFERMTLLSLFLILMIPVLFIGGLAFIFGEPLIYFTIPRLREHTWWTLLYNSILVVIVTIVFIIIRRELNMEQWYILPIISIGLSLGVMFVKVNHLKKLGFKAMVPTKVLSFGYVAVWAIYFLLVGIA